jgi:CheY-like chemotaxis protein
VLVKNKRVILIDDAAWEQVAGKLKGLFSLQGFELGVYNNCDEFGKFLDATTGSSPADIYVVDVMIPPGNRYKNEETHNGLIAGLYLAREIRQRFPLVPIILWSGTNLDTVRLLAVHMEKRLTKCIFVKKPIAGEKLLQLIEGYFAKGKFTQSWVKTIWEGIILRPEIGGLGIDVKKLLGGSSSPN